MVKELQSLEEMNSLINTGSKVLIDLWAPWCGPCKSIAPVFDKLAEKYPSVIFAKIDVAAFPDAATQFNVRGIPTMVSINNAEVLSTTPGSVNTLEQLVVKLSEA